MKKPKSTAAEQHARFVQAAKDAGADVNGFAADELMGRMAKSKPAQNESKDSTTVKRQ